MRAGAKDAIAFELPVEVIARLFLGRKDRIQMGDQGNASGRPASPRQHQVVAPRAIG